ncbi:MAG: 1,4-alpha-glucan branching protein GlgB [Oscillospiraceae bacterium]|nr:1,4-alpha-glucan branching protein GlgB [Oscillospiraceae bacterium]
MDAQHLKHIPRDDIYLFNTGNARKAWLCFGCRYVPELEAHRFLVWAPNARAVSLVGDFNGWDWGATPMEKLEGGVWAVFLEGLQDGQRYKYCVTGADGREVLKADPFAAYSQCGMETASMVWTERGYPWTDGTYMKKRAQRNFMSSPMSIYELHPGSWQIPEGGVNYRWLADSLAEYCVDMGYTHVELMPVTEYPYDGSWGYQVTGYYAPTSRYGSPDDFRYFVDKLHSVGLGVIMDWVPAHFPKDEHGLAMFDGTPLFECKERRMAEHPEWGTLIFDYASDQVQSFLVSSACKFFEEFHIDGIRVDAVSSMLYLNYARRDGEFTPNEEGGVTNLHALDFLRKMNSAVLSNYPGAVTVAEESTAFPLITAPPDVGGVGFCLKWDMGFMHDTIDYMELDPYFRSFNHNKLTFSMMYAFSENYVLAYSHDEVVHGKRSMINKMSGDYDQKFASLRALYGYQFGHPGKKLTFMGSEFGQFIEWNWKQGLDWLLLDYPRHEELRRYMRALNKLYTSMPALYAVDRSWDGFKWLNVDDAGRSSVAFLRSAEKENSYVVCVCNFTPVSYEDFVIGLPQAGTLKEILNSDDFQYGGKGEGNPKLIRSRKEAFLDMQYSAALTLPAMSTLFFRYTPKKETAGKDAHPKARKKK